MKGLIIKPCWADLILEGRKTLEVRGNNTKIRGTIAIIKSGTKQVWGTVNLTDSVLLTEDNFELWKDKHWLKISYMELLNMYPKPYVWCLNNVKKFAKPVPYSHKKGCVIWVNI